MSSSASWDIVSQLAAQERREEPGNPQRLMGYSQSVSCTGRRSLETPRGKRVWFASSALHRWPQPARSPLRRHGSGCSARLHGPARAGPARGRPRVGGHPATYPTGRLIPRTQTSWTGDAAGVTTEHRCTKCSNSFKARDHDLLELRPAPPPTRELAARTHDGACERRLPCTLRRDSSGVRLATKSMYAVVLPAVVMSAVRSGSRPQHRYSMITRLLGKHTKPILAQT